MNKKNTLLAIELVTYILDTDIKIQSIKLQLLFSNLTKINFFTFPAKGKRQNIHCGKSVQRR